SVQEHIKQVVRALFKQMLMLLAPLAKPSDCFDRSDVDGDEIVLSEEHAHLLRLNVFVILGRLHIQRNLVSGEEEVAFVLVYFWPLMRAHRILHGDRMEMKNGSEQIEFVRRRRLEVQPEHLCVISEQVGYDGWVLRVREFLLLSRNDGQQRLSPYCGRSLE